MFLQDGAAQKAVWANRQDSGSKPCMLCKNLFHLRHDHGEGEPADKIFSQYVKYSQLDIAKDDELKGIPEMAASFRHFLEPSCIDGKPSLESSRLAEACFPLLL